jgi:hypothetical protein
MHQVALLLTVAVLGVDYGWQPGEDGQLEYIIQIEPELLDTLREGKVDLLSEIPEELHGVKRFRIRVGKGPVPQKGLEEAKASGQLNTGQLNTGQGAANQQPALSGDPRARNAVNKGGGAFPAAAQQPGAQQFPTNNQPGSKVLNPPGPLNLGDPPLPDNGDRFTGGGTFPAVGRTPGINRNVSLPLDERNTSGQPNAQPNAQPNTQPPANNGAFPPATQNQNERFPNNTGNQWTNVNDPRNTNPADNPGVAPVNDPRYRDPNTGLPEIRRDNTTDPRYAGVPYRNDAWDPRDPRSQPLRDPDYNRYGPDPRDYAYNNPYNRQVDYREVASTRGAPLPPPPAATTPPTTNTAATTPPPPTASLSKVDATNRLADSPKEQPWLPLTFTAMLLFASVGLNFYLGWIANGIYLRYRALLMEVRNVRAAVA